MSEARTTVDHPFAVTPERFADRPLLTNELIPFNDFYGHASLMKQFAGLPSSSTVKAAIQHGTFFGDYVWENEYTAKVPAVLAHGPQRFPTLRSRTHKPIFTIGLPLLYAKPLLSGDELKALRKRFGRVLLAFPMHNTQHITIDYDVKEFCDYLEDFGKEFDTVMVSVYWRDLQLGRDKPYRERGFEIVSAGHIYDFSFLPRLRSMINLATVTTSNIVGSHIAQSVALGTPHVLQQKVDFRISDSTVPVSDKQIKESHHHPVTDIIADAFRERSDQIEEWQRDVIREQFGWGEEKSPGELRQIFHLCEEMYSRGESFFQAPGETALDVASDYVERGRIPEAIVLIQQSIDTSLTPRPELELMLGQLYASIQRIPEAIDSLQRASVAGGQYGEAATQQLKPLLRQHHASLLQRAMNHLTAEKFAEALHLLNMVADSGAQLEGVEMMRGICLARLGSAPEALSALQREIAAFPNNSDAKQLLAQLTQVNSTTQQTPA